MFEKIDWLKVYKKTYVGLLITIISAFLLAFFALLLIQFQSQLGSYRYLGRLINKGLIDDFIFLFFLIPIAAGAGFIYRSIKRFFLGLYLSTIVLLVVYILVLKTNINLDLYDFSSASTILIIVISCALIGLLAPSNANLKRTLFNMAGGAVGCIGVIIAIIVTKIDYNLVFLYPIYSSGSIWCSISIAEEIYRNIGNQAKTGA